MPPGGRRLTASLRWHYLVIIIICQSPGMKLRKSLIFAGIFGVIAALAGSAAMAVMYKWADENGRVAYRDTPPAGVQAERMSSGPGSAEPAAGSAMATQDPEVRKRVRHRTDDQDKGDQHSVAQ